MSSPSPRRHFGLIAVLTAALMALVLKCAWALGSQGSSDLVFFYIFARDLAQTSLAEVYRHNAMFNHTPLTALFLRALYWATHGEFLAFNSVFRMVTAFADLGLVAGLLYVRRLTGRPPWWALVVFAASPVSLMVSGFHGNVDPLMVLFLFGAAVALLARRPVWCGVLFAVASQVKIVPLLLAPLFLAWWWKEDRRAWLKFSAAAAVALLLGSGVPLVQCPQEYLHKVFGYGSYWGTWGVTYWLRQSGAEVFQAIAFKELSPAQNWVMLALKCLMIGGVLTLAWRRRAVAGAEFLTTLAAAFVVIMALAPGLGPQYLVWVAPFLLWADARWYVALTGCSAVYMFAFYHPAAKYVFPWDLAFPKGWEIAVWGPWMNLPWAAFLVLLATQARGWWRAAPARVPAATPSGGTLAAA